MDREAFLEAVRRDARELGTERPTRAQFAVRARLAGRYTRNFRRWGDALAAAGLDPGAGPHPTEAALFRELAATFLRCGGVCSRRRFLEAARQYGAAAYRRHFGTWREALVRFRRWVQGTGQPFPFLDQLPHDSLPPRRALLRRAAEARARRGSLRRRGRPFGFRGYAFEPASEQGVVMLFGTLFEELGFAVEEVRAGYPDCDACRRVGGRDDLWEPVAIEFEYRSSGFRQGGHDPAGCDLVVCWIHDWPECPVEVLELRQVVRKLNR